MSDHIDSFLNLLKRGVVKNHWPADHLQPKHMDALEFGSIVYVDNDESIEYIVIAVNRSYVSLVYKTYESEDNGFSYGIMHADYDRVRLA